MCTWASVLREAKFLTQYRVLGFFFSEETPDTLHLLTETCMGRSSTCGVKSAVANSRALVVVGQCSLTPLREEQEGTKQPLLQNARTEWGRMPLQGLNCVHAFTLSRCSQC